MQEKGQELDLEAKRGSKTKANHKLVGIFAKYNIGEIYLVDMMTKAEQKRTKTNMHVQDYIAKWLEQYRNNTAVLTYATHKNMANTKPNSKNSIKIGYLAVFSQLLYQKSTLRGDCKNTIF
jgi:hypothetical protein